MEYTMDQKIACIKRDILLEESKNPMEIFYHLAQNDYISIHGPEHHILDGSCLLMAYYNAGGQIDIEEALDKLAGEGRRMPGAACGLWGVCGAVTSMGAALSIIDKTGPLTTDGSWGEHMKFTSKAIARMGEVNGPRCCKRDAMLSFEYAIDYVNAHYNVVLDKKTMHCLFSKKNTQCIGAKCPYHT